MEGWQRKGFPSDVQPEARSVADAVSHLVRLWRLRADPLIATGGSGSWVAPVLRDDGLEAVLKVALFDPESADEADGLRVWHGQGAVKLYDDWTDGVAYGLLIERCVPGDPLREVLPEQDQDVVVVDLLRRLWVTPPKGHSFRFLREMCEMWARERQATLPQCSVSERSLVEEGLKAWLDLAADTSVAPVLLATDLHAGNILRAQREPWLAIDPKPYVGDPTYDLLQHMTNCTTRLATDPRALIARMAALAGVDAERLRSWTFARLLVDSDWPFGSTGSPTNIEVARLIAPA